MSTSSTGDSADPGGQRFTLRETHGEAGVTLAVSGELDLLSAPELERAVRALVEEAPAPALVVDLSAVTFMDSTGMSAVVTVSELCRRHGVELSLVPGPPSVRGLFQMTGLEELLPFQADASSERLSEDAILPLIFKPASSEEPGGSG